MTQVHLISQYTDLNQLQQNLDRYAATKDTLLFIAEGVLSLTNETVHNWLKQQAYDVLLLEADCLCRGLNALTPPCQLISDEQMVELLVNNKNISW
ncbi:MAG: DsrH/TusB family sulfur relay protein [Gammaproteobacteria bacterium]|nr:DsrH/TusB family sulfur relay protein [Gammaproteobacteria bacterium]MDH5630682.1 DsrH/TusB family sulfur relay protein [Gammaproteobacteria bacterium]